jgi:predicted O-linked N-acetylglucosamine transferase (SPINDLY family)
LDVELVDATAAEGAGDFKMLGGFECKAHALAACRFEQVFLLDADNIPLVDPQIVLESHEFKRHGQVFWPDFYYQPGHTFAIRPRSWTDFGLTPRAGLELESGQLAVDRIACWKQLQLVRLLNVHSDRCYGAYTWGDKDTFTLSWLISGREYYSMPIRPRYIDRTRALVFWQYGLDGAPGFQHQRKWLDPPEQVKAALLDDELVKQQSLKYLVRFWDAVRSAGEESRLLSMLQLPVQMGITAPREPTGLDPEELRRSSLRHFEEGEWTLALTELQRAARLAPDTVEYRIDLSAMLCRAERPQEALPHLVQALRLDGKRAEVHNNLGVALEQLGRYGEAASAYQNALSLRPNYVQAQHNLAKASRLAGDPATALRAYRAALTSKPDSVTAYEGLVTVGEDVGDARLMIDSQWALCRLQPESPGVNSGLLYNLHYDPAMGRKGLYAEHLRWAERFSPSGRKQLPRRWNVLSQRRLRVGYLSPDFREHTVPRFIGAALAHHDTGGFEVFCYSDVTHPDRMTGRLRGAVERWRDTVGLPDERVSKLIGEDRIDVLVDLRGHAASNRMTLLAARVAPVQINMVGYFDTTGLSNMDYRLTDAHQDPPGSEEFHTETLLRMPHTCWCFSPDVHAPPVGPLPSKGRGYITFGSLNKLVKVSAPCARLWARVLQAVPDSRLLLTVNSAGAVEMVRDRLQEAGLPGERLVVELKSEHVGGYHDRFNQIDVALDTFPFNGITTTCDGLWMGVPLVSLSGQTSVSRTGRSILHGVGLPHLAVESDNEFVSTAVALAGEPVALADLRANLRDRMLHSPLMDHAGFTRTLECMYLQVADPQPAQNR